MYYKEAVGALVVFDVTRVTTFEAVTKWKNDIDAKVVLPDGKPIPVVLLANKVRSVPQSLCEHTPCTRSLHQPLTPTAHRLPKRTQCDLAKEGLVKNADQMNKYCEDKGFIAWYVHPTALFGARPLAPVPVPIRPPQSLSSPSPVPSQSLPSPSPVPPRSPPLLPSPFPVPPQSSDARPNPVH